MNTNLKILMATLGVVIFLSCQKQETAKQEDQQSTKYLSSWKNSKNRDAIISYVEEVTNTESPNFIEVRNRVAVFDNDGTLWSEQPLYFQFLFAVDQVKKNADNNPEWKKEEPFKSILEGKLEAVLKQGHQAVFKIIGATHGGMTAKEFDKEVREWAATAKHPRFNKPYTQVIYQPMVELLEYLRANDFKTFIVSGGGVAFMRPFTEEMYGIPADQVVGSMVKAEFVNGEEGPQVIRKEELFFFDDKEYKPIGIYNGIGKQPVFAAGNSDGDLQMLQWTDANELKSFQLYVHHDDSVREWAYDSLSHIGQFKEGWKEAIQKDWTVVSMKNDWKVIYPFEN